MTTQEKLDAAKAFLGSRWQQHPHYNRENHPQHPVIGNKAWMVPWIKIKPWHTRVAPFEGDPFSMEDFLELLTIAAFAFAILLLGSAVG